MYVRRTKINSRCWGFCRRSGPSVQFAANAVLGNQSFYTEHSGVSLPRAHTTPSGRQGDIWGSIPVSFRQIFIFIVRPQLLWSECLALHVRGVWRSSFGHDPLASPEWLPLLFQEQKDPTFPRGAPWNNVGRTASLQSHWPVLLWRLRPIWVLWEFYLFKYLNVHGGITLTASQIKMSQYCTQVVHGRRQKYRKGNLGVLHPPLQTDLGNGRERSDAEGVCHVLMENTHELYN